MKPSMARSMFALFIPISRAILGRVTELFFNSEKLIVFGCAIASAGGAGFDLAAVGGHSDVGDCRIFGFAGAVGEDGGIAVSHGQVYGGEGFAQGADLVH